MKGGEMIMTSRACRVQAEDIKGIELQAGMNQLGPEALTPRQLRLVDSEASCAAVIKPHRGGWIPVIQRETALSLVDAGQASWEPQRALVYSVEEYLADPDVSRDAEESGRATRFAEEGGKLVLVAIIGESRSPLAVCRNIVSGCQHAEKLVQDAEAAMKAANVFLVE
jgi:hypothetical protein